jgi:hypothetical protein
MSNPALEESAMRYEVEGGGGCVTPGPVSGRAQLHSETSAMDIGAHYTSTSRATCGDAASNGVDYEGLESGGGVACGGEEVGLSVGVVALHRPRCQAFLGPRQCVPDPSKIAN